MKFVGNSRLMGSGRKIDLCQTAVQDKVRKDKGQTQDWLRTG